MSCWLCEHAHEINKLHWEQEAEEQKRLGLSYDTYRASKAFKCRLNPVWVDVRGSHVCGQFRDNHWTNPYKVAEIRDRMDERYEEEKAVRERARNAERKLKAANAKIKALRAAKNA